MIFSYNWLQSFFQRKLPKPEKLAELLTLHFAEVEEVRKEGRDFIWENMSKLREQEEFERFVREEDEKLKKSVCLRKLLGYCFDCKKDYNPINKRLNCDNYAEAR